MDGLVGEMLLKLNDKTGKTIISILDLLVYYC